MGLSEFAAKIPSNNYSNKTKVMDTLSLIKSSGQALETFWHAH